MTRRIWLVALFLAFGALSGIADSAVPSSRLIFSGKCEGNPMLYKCGEKMTFTITLEDKENRGKPLPGWKLRWTRRGDDGLVTNGEATSENPLVINTSIDRPGFVRIRVEVLDAAGKVVKDRNAQFDGGAGADVNNIPAYPMPGDFDAFWDAEVKKILDSKYEAKLTPVNWPTKGIKVFKFEVTTFPGERPATGLIGYREDAQPGTQGLVVAFTGYGFGRYWVNDNVIRQGNVMVSVSRQGEDPIASEEYYKSLQQNEMKSFCFRKNNDRYGNDFYKMIMRNLRAMQYAKSFKGLWNGKRMRSEGGSMGGFQAVAAAALDKDVTELGAFIPWVADLAGKSRFKRMEGWRPAFTETLGYFDTANLASRVTCPTVVTIGLGDYICPPSGQVILFRNLKGKKTLNVHQNFGHGSSYGDKTVPPFVFKEVIE